MDQNIKLIENFEKDEKFLEYLEESNHPDAFDALEFGTKFTEELLNKIKKINEIGIKINIEEEVIKNTFDKYFKKYLYLNYLYLNENKFPFSTKNIIKDFIIKEYKHKIKDYFNKLKKYDYFIEIFNNFSKYTNLNNTSILENNNYIINKLEELKEKGILLNEDYTVFIYKIYDLSYKFMKYEFITTKESKLYDYFISNNHDFWYINKFIEKNIEEIESSLNYIFNYDNLINTINKKSNKNHLMSEDIIIQLAICENIDYYKNLCNKKLKNFYNRFKNIYNKVIFDITPYGMIMPKNLFENLNIRKIRKSYLSLLKEYNAFLKNEESLVDLKEEYLHEISNLKLKISSQVTLKEEVLNGIYRIKKKINKY